MLQVEKTTYDVGYGEMQPCFEVFKKDNRKTFMRFAPCFRIVGPKTTYIFEFVDGEFNSRDEINVSWDSMNATKAKQLTKRLSTYV